MSYTKTFKKSIKSIHEGSVYCSQDDVGTYKHYRSEEWETIYFEVTVDTEPFDDSIDDMKDRVDTLTGCITATEAAQVASIYENSRKVGQTIVSGFFKTVRSDISQQITQLKIKADALLLQLHELAKRCNDKKRVMNEDYQNISARYAKIFGELDREMENRVRSVDEPIFRFVGTTSHIDEGLNKMVSVPTVHAAENARVHSKITAAHAKKQANDTLQRMQNFLNVQYSTDRILSKCLIPESHQASFTTPYCVIEAKDESGRINTNVYTSPIINNINHDHLAELRRQSTDDISALSNKEVHDYFNAEVANMVAQSPSQHTERVAQMAGKLMNANSK